MQWIMQWETVLPGVLNHSVHKLVWFLKVTMCEFNASYHSMRLPQTYRRVQRSPISQHVCILLYNTYSNNTHQIGQYVKKSSTAPATQPTVMAEGSAQSKQVIWLDAYCDPYIYVRIQQNPLLLQNARVVPIHMQIGKLNRRNHTLLPRIKMSVYRLSYSPLTSKCKTADS